MPGDRTEQATPRRREKAREQGDILRSRELPGAAAVLAGVLSLGVLGRQIANMFRGIYVSALALSASAHAGVADQAAGILSVRRNVVVALIPVCAVLAFMAIAAALCGILQTGGLQISTSAMSLHFDRINPITNLKNLLSLRAASRIAKSLLPAGVLAFFAVQRIARELRTPPFSTARIAMLGADVYGLVLAAALVLFVWSLVDYVVEWRSRESRLRMSREEMKEEFKESEGNPQIRGRIRGLQRQLRRRKVKADVSKAAVVLTNPTHYAVALGFDFAKMDAPKVLAKGRNLMAEEIKAEARWAGVPIVENPPLARSLFRSVEVGRQIPVDLYAAVAAILAYLYRQRVEAEMRQKRRESSTAKASPASAETSRRSANLDDRSDRRPEGERRSRNGESS